MRKRDRVQRLGEGTDLVDLDQQRVPGFLRDTPRKPLRIGDEQVVTNELYRVAEPGCEPHPAAPVVLGEWILDRHDRVGRDQFGVVVAELLGGTRRSLELVGPVGEELGRGHVQSKGDVLPRPESRLVDGRHKQVERGPVGGQVRGETAFVTDSGRQPLGLEHALERLICLGAPAQRLGKGRRPDRGNHELLDVDVCIGVRAAVDNVHHRYRQQMRAGTTEIAVQRQVRGFRGGPRNREAHPEDGVRPQAGLVRRSVQIQQRQVENALLGGFEAHDLGPDAVNDTGYRLPHALTAVTGVAVTQFDRLEGAGARATGYGGTAESAVIQDDFDLDGGVATRVKDLAGAYGLDGRHGFRPPE